jgi:hypothetical protein
MRSGYAQHDILSTYVPEHLSNSRGVGNLPILESRGCAPMELFFPAWPLYSARPGERWRWSLTWAD